MGPHRASETAAPAAGTKFVLLSQPRSGSNWLLDMLQQLDEVTAYDELFLRRPRQEVSLFRDHPRYHALPHGRFGRRPSAVAYVHRLFRQPGAVGFKAMGGQLRPYPQVWAYLAARRASIVHLVRANLLEALISEQVAASNERWHIRSGEPTQDGVRLEVDAADLLRRCEARAADIGRTRRRLRALRFRHLEVSYEDLVSGDAAFAAVCRFLRLGDVAAKPASALSRTRNAPTSELVTNYDEVRRAFAASPLAPLLDAPTLR